MQKWLLGGTVSVALALSSALAQQQPGTQPEQPPAAQPGQQGQAGADEALPSGFKAEPVLKDTKTADGDPIQVPTGTVEIVSVVGTLDPGGRTARHQHPVPVFVYILEGELELEQQNLMRQIIGRIELAAGELRLQLDRSRLASLFGSDRASAPASECGNGVIDIIIPVTLRRRGVEARLIVGNGSGAARANEPDTKLVGLLATAHRALTMFTAGEAESINDVAEQTCLDASDVTRILPLAFLAPSFGARYRWRGDPVAAYCAVRLRYASLIPGPSA